MAGAFRRLVSGRLSRRVLLAGLLAAVWFAWLVWPGRPIVWFGLPPFRGEFEAPILLPGGQTLAVAYDPPPAQEGKFIRHRSGPIQLWDLTTGRERSHILGDDLKADVCGFAPDGSWLLARSGDGRRLTVFDAMTGRERATFRLGDGGFAISPDGRMLAVHGDDRHVHLWDATADRVTAALPAAHPVIAFAGDGRTLAIADPTVFPGGIYNPRDWADPKIKSLDAARGGAQGSVRICDSDTGAVRATLTVPVFAYVSLAISSDGRRLALYRSDPPDGAWPLWDNRVEDGVLVRHPRTWTDILQFWDARDEEPVRTLATHSRPDNGDSGRPEFSPDGRLLLVRRANTDGWDTGLLWDVSQNPPRPREDWLDPWRQAGMGNRMPTDGYPIFAPRGGRMLTPAVGFGALELWDTADGGLRAVCRVQCEGRPSPVFAPDGRTFAAVLGGDDENQTALERWVRRQLSLTTPRRFRVRLCDADTGAEQDTRTIAGVSGRVLGFSPDGESYWLCRVEYDEATGQHAATVERWAIRTSLPPLWLLAVTALGVLLAVADLRRSRRAAPVGEPLS